MDTSALRSGTSSSATASSEASSCVAEENRDAAADRRDAKTCKVKSIKYFYESTSNSMNNSIV